MGRNYLVLFTLLYGIGPLAWADPPSIVATQELQREVRSLREMVEALRKVVITQGEKIALLQSGLTQAATGDSGMAPVQAASYAANNGVRGQFNPDIGVVADMVGILSESEDDEEGNDRISAREVEIVFGHDVDPYLRLDSTVAFSDGEEASLEEAYLSYWGLPVVLNLKVGRFRPRVGVATTLHRDSLDTIDEPFVVADLFGPEGYSRTGAEVSGFLPLPYDSVTHELIAGVLEGGSGEEGALFGETRRRPTLYGRLRNFWEIDEISSLNLGVSFLTGSSDEDAGFEVRAAGIDSSFTRYIGEIGRLKLLGEVYLQERSELAAEGENIPDISNENTSPLGSYVLFDYRFAQRWAAGARWDYLEPTLAAAGIVNRAYSTYLTFMQSEFARLRFQYQRAELSESVDDNRFMLQATAAIGTHKHQLQ